MKFSACIVPVLFGLAMAAPMARPAQLNNRSPAVGDAEGVKRDLPLAELDGEDGWKNLKRAETRPDDDELTKPDEWEKRDGDDWNKREDDEWEKREEIKRGRLDASTEGESFE